MNVQNNDMDKRVMRRDAFHKEELRIVIFGSSGPSQFHLTNCILGRKEFSKVVCSIAGCRKNLGKLAGRWVSVVNAPNFYDKDLSRSKMEEELRRSKCLSSPGLHAALVVLDLEKLSPNDISVPKLVTKHFGESVLGHTLILLSYEGHLERAALEDWILRRDSHLRVLVEQCGGRFHVFSRSWRDPTWSRELLEKIEKMLKNHGGMFYSNKSYARAERSIRKEEKRLLKKRAEEMKRVWRELEEQYRGEELRKKMEEYEACVGAEIRAKAELDNRWLRTSLAVGIGLGFVTGVALGSIAGVVEGPVGVAVGGAIGGAMCGAAGGAVQVAMKNIEDRVVPQARTFSFNSVFINRFYRSHRSGL
ncbi:hypothetical protein Z043_124278 [Scleropages formosus]|uniref:AIG1-type G domain-containing protein n=1 Tax=Scleropages formosus TaxID=113540 RepID=A0A0P7W5Q5_SCLFO|nr:hypothetical protein Z043_124278 [Scleropages formosus]